MVRGQNSEKVADADSFYAVDWMCKHNLSVCPSAEAAPIHFEVQSQTWSRPIRGLVAGPATH